MGYVSLSNRRAAFVHFKLPTGDFQDYALKITSIMRARLEETDHLEIVYGTGGCDLLVRLSLQNFRSIADIQDALLATDELSCSWVFSVPYDSEKLVTLDESSNVQFVTHLRVDRYIYDLNGVSAEQQLLQGLESLLEEARLESKIFAEIQAGIGWSDIIISGSFSESPTRLLSLLLKIRELHIVDDTNPEERLYAIQKSLTTLGISAPDGKLDREQLRHSVREIPTLAQVRIRPGGFRDFVASIEALELSNLHIVAHDGTFDISIFPASTLGTSSAEASQILESITHGTSDSASRGIERTETHLLFARPQDALRDVELADAQGKLALPLKFSQKRRQLHMEQSTPRCLQVEKLRSELAELEKLQRSDAQLSRLIPDSLIASLSSVLSILRHSTSDGVNHFDSLSAVSACLFGLQNVLKEFDFYFRIRQDLSDARLEFNYQQMEVLREFMRIWCELSQRILSERTAGSHEEFFGIGDRLPSFRGGVQKFLLLADQILHEFYLEVTGENPIKTCPRFATVHEPIDEIKSVPLLGVVKIPLKNRFSLARVVPDLWHEVGVYIFRSQYLRGWDHSLRNKFREYDEKRSSELERARIAGYGVFQRTIKDKFTSLSPEQLHSILSEKIESQSEAYSIRNHDFFEYWTDEDVTTELTEMYADGFVYYFGFRQVLSEFVLNLASSRIELLSTSRLPKHKLMQEYSKLLRRIFAVQLVQQWLSEGLHTGQYIPPAGPRMIGIAAFLRDSILNRGRFRDQWHETSEFFPPSLAEESIMEAIDLVESERFKIIYKFTLVRLVQAIQRRESSVRHDDPCTPEKRAMLRSGKLVDMTASEVNYFAKYIHLADFGSFLDRKRDDEEATSISNDLLEFRAALSRSALIAFHRSQIAHHPPFSDPE